MARFRLVGGARASAVLYVVYLFLIALHLNALWHIPADPVRYLTSLPWRDGKRGLHGNQRNGFCATGVGAVRIHKDGAEKARGRGRARPDIACHIDSC